MKRIWFHQWSFLRFHAQILERPVDLTSELLSVDDIINKIKNTSMDDLVLKTNNINDFKFLFDMKISKLIIVL